MEGCIVKLTDLNGLLLESLCPKRGCGRSRAASQRAKGPFINAFIPPVERGGLRANFRAQDGHPEGAPRAP